MKKFYWLIVGALVGFFTVMFSYVGFNFLTNNGTGLNPVSTVVVIAIYAIVIYVIGLLHEKLK